MDQKYLVFLKTPQTTVVSASSPKTAEAKFRMNNGIPINSEVIVVPSTFARVNGIEIKSEIKNFKRID